MHVGAKRLFGQPASACFCPCEEKRFCEKKKKIKNDAIFGPQKRGPIFEFDNLQNPGPKIPACSVVRWLFFLNYIDLKKNN